ncbi:ABC transporter substrate-binding protein [Arthrobacter sp. OV608]|uniref:ABC transporter substrate-binding protein n=1 Tax=Arthrobacter sp. OV608 TaxID=1882768 RepID=UPI0008B91E75|nr:ABC transporter substrate-binding protein [Arthrobacter sp. OV608]SER28283.1 ABC-type nitrate/sulfonate/bicarbonate transport system, substrate-binding protein [Arthrobacter sp. OV608]
MKIRKAANLLTLTVTLAATAVSAAACAPGKDQATANSLTAISFQTFPGTMQTIPVKVAQDQGFFKDNGLEVTANDGANGPAMLAALAAGQVDVAGIPMFVGTQALVSGVKAKAVVGLIGGGGTTLFVSDRVAESDAPYPESAKVLEGRTAAIAAPGGFTDRLFKRYVDGAGGPMKYETIPGIPPQIAAMKAGKVDVVHFDLVGAYAAAKQGLGRVLWDFQTTGPEDLIGASTSEAWMSDKFLEEKPEKAKAFARSIAQASAWIKDPANKAEAGKYFSGIAGVEVAEQDLAPMIKAVSPVVGPRDVEVYNGLFPEGTQPLSPSAVLAPMAPQDDAAAEKLATEK